MGNPGYEQFRSMPDRHVCFPYLIIESKAYDGDMIIAENQSFISGRISLDMTWPVLGDQDMVFLLSTIPYLAHMYVMWREVIVTTTPTETKRCPRYYIRLTSSFALTDLEQFKKFRIAIFHIQHWAVNNRL